MKKEKYLSAVEKDYQLWFGALNNNFDDDFWRLSQWWFETPEPSSLADRLYDRNKTPIEAARIIERLFGIFVAGQKQKVRFDVINQKGMPEPWSGYFPNHRKADKWFLKYGVKHEARGHNLVKVLVGNE